MRIVLHWIILSAAVWATTELVGGVTLTHIWVALIVGACLTLFNMFLRPIINILTLPLNILTLGFFSLIVNGILFWYLGSGIITGFSVVTFQAAFIGALLVSVLNWILIKLFHFNF